MMFDRIVLIVALIWYILTAYFSVGYYHADEHYQIIEFAGYKEGAVKANELAWEFKSQIRPATQVAIAYVIFALAEDLGINDPYLKAFILRLITALLAVFVIYFFACSCRKFISPKYWRFFLVLSFFMWFLPFINVRFSSETWSGLALLPAMALAFKESKTRADFIFIGVLAGLSFLFRYQIAIAVLGLLLWLLLIKKENILNLVILLSSGAFIITIGTFIDYWLYGNFVLAPWNYLKLNLFAGKAAEFGTSPWFYYFYYVFRFAFFPFGTIIIASFLVLLIKKPRDIFVWTVFLFVFVHSLIPHKELRFLFPVVNLAPIIIILAFQEVNIHKAKRKWRKLILISGMLLGLINLTALVAASIKPADIGRMRITEAIQRVENDKPINLIFYESSNPYDPWRGIVARHYLLPGMHFKPIKSLNQFDSTLIEKRKRNLLVLRMKDVQKPGMSKLISDLGFKKIDQSMPEYLLPLLKIYGGFNMGEVLILYSTE